MKSTETGSALYSELDSRPEEIEISIVRGLYSDDGVKLAGETSFDLSEAEADIRIDPKSANHNGRLVGLRGNDGEASTMAHELGHVKGVLDDSSSLSSEKAHEPGNKAEEYQDKVIEELKEQYEDEEDE